MQNKEQYGVKTGRLKPPRQQGYRAGEQDYRYYHERAGQVCHETRKDTLLFADERGGLSWRTVRRAKTMKLPLYVLASYRFVTSKKFPQGKVVEQLGIIGEMI